MGPKVNFIFSATPDFMRIYELLFLILPVAMLKTLKDRPRTILEVF